MGDARVVFLLEKIGETFGVSPDELRGDMDGLGDKVRPFFEPEGPHKLIFVYQAPDTVDPKTGAVTRVGAKRLALTDGEANDMPSFNATLDRAQNGVFGDVQICLMGLSLVKEDIGARYNPD